MSHKHGPFLLLLVAPVLLAQSTAQNGASISGRVTNSLTGAGIGGATVNLCLPNAPSVSTDCLGQPHTTVKGVTDEVGAYRITGVADGQYTTLPAFKRGFLTNMVLSQLHVFGDTRLDIQMTPFASVRGRVLDPEGKPASGITVKDGSIVEDQVTDENGEYVFEDIPPGMTLVLSATPPAGRGPAPQDGETIVTTYYPSVVDSDQAVRIHVQGVDLIGYDIRLRTARAHAIRGVVLDVDGKPAAGVMVGISKPASGVMTSITGPVNYQWGWPSVAGAQPVETNEDGTFAFPPVMKGEWNVRADLRPENPRSTPNHSAAINVRVSDSEIENLEIHLDLPFQIELTADWGDPPPSTTPTIVAMVSALDGPPGIRPPISSTKPGEPRRIAAFPGRFYIAAPRGTSGYYAAAVMMDNRDVLGQVVDISGPTSLKVVYKIGAGSLRGTVEKCGDGIVILMADETPYARLGFSAQCDANGGFVIPDLPPGTYTAIALQEFQFSTVTIPNFPSLFPSLLTANGKRVKVEAGATAQVELKVTRQP